MWKQALLYSYSPVVFSWGGVQCFILNKPPLYYHCNLPLQIYTTEWKASDNKYINWHKMMSSRYVPSEPESPCSWSSILTTALHMCSDSLGMFLILLSFVKQKVFSTISVCSGFLPNLDQPWEVQKADIVWPLSQSLWQTGDMNLGFLHLLYILYISCLPFMASC